ncbi:hypothetical protein VdG1_00524 [Verticillium dahliae VDG1]|nr:hypothetical protein VdG1_00524 [Verticillium dahliae VDG1]
MRSGANRTTRHQPTVARQSTPSSTLVTIVQNGTADKLRTQQELERLQSKLIGTGHPDTTSWEWKTNIHRDTYASIVGHPPMLAYIALAENEPVHLVRARLIRKMLQPAGAPPQRDNE